MNVDKITLDDLSIFAREEENSIFSHLNFTRTTGGREWLRFYIRTPLDSAKEIQERQDTLKKIQQIKSEWPLGILNGTIMVLEKFYESSLSEIPRQPNPVDALLYQITYRSDYSLIEYSVGHFVEFVQGLKKITQLLSNPPVPPFLQIMLSRMESLLSRTAIQTILASKPRKTATPASVLRNGSFLRRQFKSECFELIEIYSKLDAFYSMAIASETLHFTFPEVSERPRPFLHAENLYHPLVHSAVSYDVSLTPEKNFLFLTGANMAGKSTFIKAIGVAVYLAHLGMGVPAQSMQLSFFEGLLSNIQVADNVIKGESYFFNEVQRIRKTIEKINDGKKWLILIDELFKGTNVQDAMKCSTTVIEGLRKMQNTLFILSTHLYEIGENLKQYPNIVFRYFETGIEEDELIFNYQLKEGISNDRLGYLILKKEGVVDMLKLL